MQISTLGFLIHVFIGRPDIDDLWGLGGPGAPKNYDKIGGLGPQPSVMVWGPPGPPRPQTSTMSGRPKNHVLKIQFYSGLHFRSANSWFFKPSDQSLTVVALWEAFYIEN